MKYDLDRIIDRYDTHSVKYESMQVMHPKATSQTLPLWVADMDFPCPEPVLDAIKGRVDRKILGYSSHQAGEYLRAVTGWMKKRFDWEVAPADIHVAPGVVPALNHLVRALTEKGDGVIIQRPVYYPFTTVVVNNGRKVVNNALINNEGYYTMDFEDLERKAEDPANKMMILCSPHNPVGRVWTREELLRIGEICLKNDVILISDEIHFDLVRKGITHIPIDKLFPQTDRIITCTAPSKTFNLAGMHTSNIIIRNDELKSKWTAEAGHIGLSPLSIVAVIAAYQESEDWLEQVKEYIDKNLDFIGEFMKEQLPEGKYVKPEGTYLVWIDLRAYEPDYRVLSDLMVEEAGVLLDDGHIFGDEGDGYERINAACPRAILEDCMKRIAKAVVQHKGRTKA